MVSRQSQNALSDYVFRVWKTALSRTRVGDKSELPVEGREIMG